MKKNEAIKKRKIWAVLIWTLLYMLYSIWGNEYLEPAGLAADPRGNVYVSLIDTYRDEARIRKMNPSGKVVWTRTYQGKHLAAGKSENILITPGHNIYQILSKLSENSAYLSVLCYDSGGKLRWSRDLYGIPYFKENSLDGNDLIIVGLESNNISFKIIRIQPDGKVSDPLYVFNPLEQGVTRFAIVKNGLLVTKKQSTGMKLVQVDFAGKTVTNTGLTSRVLLGADEKNHIYLAQTGDKTEVTQYTSDGRFLWQTPVSRSGHGSLRRVIEPEYLDFDLQSNIYLTGKDQVFTSHRDFLKAIYNKGRQYHFQHRTYYRTRGGDRIFLTKINAKGKQVWMKELATHQSNPVPRGLAVDSNANVYVT
ncbi:MAG TPA: hypothetical protein VEC37_04160, partial [Bacillota bacterium]|nr:hypothetical protein [Bacillota bacterium]